jgi:GH15 family glucan-1,4-alpha-glucosidase
MSSGTTMLEQDRREPTKDLLASSVAVILENQNALGAYIASPGFRDYRYCWLRDGSFIAYAMLRAGRPDSARRFLLWCAATIERHEPKVRALARILRQDRIPGPQDFLPARYTMDGRESSDGWPCFQVDGYGAWLWCLEEYVKATGEATLVEECRRGIEVTIDYLRIAWPLPCYDCWEENGDKVHPSSLACVHGGLAAASRMLRRPELEGLAGEIKGFILTHLTPDGRLPKYVGSESIDASLLWVSVPFAVLSPLDPVMGRTAALIEARLLEKGGVKRYPEDTYFGGGQWLLLTCWLGWYHARTARGARARESLSWVEARADADGLLAEQDLAIVNDPRFIARWEERSGKVARPLLWSHAMYLVLRGECL